MTGAFKDVLWHRVLRRPYHLSAHKAGEGQPIVLLHGLGASREVWEPLIEKLDHGQWQIITMDLLGFGKSPRPGWNPYDAREHGKAVRATLKRLRVTKPVTIVGHSMGCLVAAHVAAHRPKTVKRLVLFEPPLFADLDEFRAHKSLRKQYFKVFEYILAHPEMLLTKKRLLKLVHRMYGLNVNQDAWVPFERSIRNTIMEQRMYEDLQKINVPTDIIYGRLDFIVNRAEVSAMFKKRSNITMHVANHMHSISPRAVTFIAKLLK